MDLLFHMISLPYFAFPNLTCREGGLLLSGRTTPFRITVGGLDGTLGDLTLAPLPADDFQLTS